MTDSFLGKMERVVQETPVNVAEKHGALEDIADERRRQIEDEGWSPEHDDTHSDGQIARAAAAYALAGSWRDTLRSRHGAFSQWSGGQYSNLANLWPWDWEWFKPKDRRRDLVRAGALIVAEIERLDRAAAHRS